MFNRKRDCGKLQVSQYLYHYWRLPAVLTCCSLFLSGRDHWLYNTKPLSFTCSDKTLHATWGIRVYCSALYHLKVLKCCEITRVLLTEYWSTNPVPAPILICKDLGACTVWIIVNDLYVLQVLFLEKRGQTSIHFNFLSFHIFKLDDEWNNVKEDFF